MDLGCGSDDSTGWSQYCRITVWIVVALILIGLICWLAGPWLGVTGAGAFGAAKAGKTARRVIANKNGGAVVES
ncbi:hypothetical protein [Amycolatopsis rubida]|uniref:hypothetical protein n=1 Tax=Amycolatopsis rubida TaxID=112413 RepID=UPI000B812279|nr:hypothetical protein [Amycolatopsis rubida]